MTLGMLTCGLNSALDTMKNSLYSIIPIHKRPELFVECCRLINAEWPASETRRLRTFTQSCETFPTCLVMLHREKVVGHCKLSLIPNEDESCFLGSVVIDRDWRSQGLGSLLLRGAEEYAAERGIKNIYLSTKGQEGFYLKNGYRVCEPVNLWNYISLPIAPTTLGTKGKADRREFSGPPPPPMPEPVSSPAISSSLTSSKTYMLKCL